MASSSVSVLVFEKQKFTVSQLQRSPRHPQGLGFAEGRGALDSRSPANRLSCRLTTKSMRTAHNEATIRVALTKLRRLWPLTSAFCVARDGRALSST
jgi:hypothetical protein